MLNNGFNNINIQKKALDASWFRQSLLANNIANVNTPGYKREDIAFEDMLDDFLNQRKLGMVMTNDAHFSHVASVVNELVPTVITDKSTSYRIDGNNVNVDLEMAAVAQNTIKYNAMTTQLNSQIRRLKASIRGGK